MEQNVHITIKNIAKKEDLLVTLICERIKTDLVNSQYLLNFTDKNDLFAKILMNYEVFSSNIFWSHKKYEIPDLVNMPYYKKIIGDLGDEMTIKNWLLNYHSKFKTHKDNIFYRVEGGGGSNYAGMGNGLYLGKDKIALSNFYDMEQEGLPITKYIAKNIKFLDICPPNKHNQLLDYCQKNNISIVNSMDINNFTIALGYDGIRYYDPLATGEEFVVFNTTKLTKM